MLIIFQCMVIFVPTNLPTPLVSFHTQFRTSGGRVTSVDPRQGSRRGPTGAELAASDSM